MFSTRSFLVLIDFSGILLKEAEEANNESDSELVGEALANIQSELRPHHPLK